MREPESLGPYIEALQEVVGGGIEVGEEEVEGGKRLLISTEAKQWSFCPAQASRLTKERAAQILSSGERTSVEGTGEKQAPREREEDSPLLAASHVTDEAGRLLREQGVSYLDKAGNCYLSDGSLLLFVHGQKPSDDRQARRPVRAFNKSGLKLIFALLTNEDTLNWTYRELAGLVGISRGAVGYVMSDLETLGFLEKTSQGRHLRQRRELIERWTTGYAERLRPKLLRGRYRLIPEWGRGGWQNQLSGLGSTQWSGEPAADLLTGTFRPALLTLYTWQATSTVCEKLEAAPDPEGGIEILDMFWDPEDLTPDGTTANCAPPLLVYADLVALADPRGLNIARKIRKEHLGPTPKR